MRDIFKYKDGETYRLDATMAKDLGVLTPYIEIN